MPTPSQARQARRILDEKYDAGTVDALRIRPRSGWIKAVRTALGMSQDTLSKRLGVTRGAVTNLEHAERDGAITVAKLAEVAAALNCTVIYALVPRNSLEQIVQDQAARVVDRQLGYVNATMALEDQSVASRDQDPIRADQISAAIDGGDIWRHR
jgi:predicted DNA-binding mobile mystery protein A